MTFLYKVTNYQIFNNFTSMLHCLTFQSLPVTWCTNTLTFNNCTFCTHCIYVFCIYLRTNSDLCHLQHKLIGFYNRDECAYCAVQTGSLNKTVVFKGLNVAQYQVLRFWRIIFSNNQATPIKVLFVNLLYRYTHIVPFQQDLIHLNVCKFDFFQMKQFCGCGLTLWIRSADCFI